MVNISFLPEHIFSIGSFSITNSLLVVWLAMLILIIVGWRSSKKIHLIPSGIQNVVELAIEMLYNLVTSVTGDEKQSRKFFPLLATIFLLVLLSNWLGLVPGVGSIGFYEEIPGHEGEVLVPFFRAGAADMNFTLALAIISVFSAQYFGITALGAVKHAKKFFNFKSPILLFVGILELIGEFAKLISFSFRLFGNVFAGEVLLLVISFLVPYVVPLPFYALEVVVGIIQAFIFTMLTLVFLKMATMMHEEHQG